MNEELMNEVKSKLFEKCEGCTGEPDEMCFVAKEVEDYGVDTIKSEIVSELGRFPLEALYFITYMFKHNDFQAQLEVEDFVAFVRSVTRLLPMERKDEIIEFTKAKANDFLQEEVKEELTRKLTEMIKRSVHGYHMECR